jgi:RNA polymerase subunit RPABC4/transcription elongation factor Spt4
MATLTLGPWESCEIFCQAPLSVNGVRVYEFTIYARTPHPGTPRCRISSAVTISSFIGDLWQASRCLTLKSAAEMLAQMGVEPGDLENFFQAATDMGWEDQLVLEASRAANEFITAPESPAYLVIYLLSGVLEYEYLPTLAEAQKAVADHCGVETTDLETSTAVPWGAVFSATDENNRDAWAFPIHDSGANISDLSARVEVISQHRWQLWEAFHTAAARLRIHGLEVPGVNPPPHNDGCPYCGSQHTVTKNVFAEASPALECQDCKSIWASTCPECGSTDIAHAWILDRSPSGFVHRQTLTWECHTCEHTWDWDEAVKGGYQEVTE